MSQLVRAGQAGAIDVAADQATAKQQLAILADMLRQIGGNASVVAGSLVQADPLNSPFTLYVNPYTGSDRFVGGSYNSHEAGATDEEIIASKLKRIELQRLECGYTPQRPFKTINRAVIEAAIITSKNWYTYTDPRAHVDCVSIVLAPAVHTLYNDPGSSSTSIASWGSSKDPSVADLIAFNPANVGGVLLPRGCSLCGPDLRKTTIRPTWVPAAADEVADYSNRRGMLKITGTGYFFGFTVMDKVGLLASHHLLDAFHFASKTELDAFYAKCLSAVGTGADLGSALTVSRSTEYQIVGPIDTTQAPTESWDTTASASPYIFNCSIRSDYGLGGAFMDGAKVSGLKSMVCANFTGVSLQKDMSSWQRFDGANWVQPSYAEYISTIPNNIRMNPARLSRHIAAVNDAFIQEVSVFAIGHGIHHFTDLGAEITVTNSNSSFGSCASLSRGYKTYAFPQDRNWTVGSIRVPLNLSQKTGNVRRIFLGTIQSISATKITLDTALATDEASATVPAVLLRDKYSLANGTKIWVENPTGDHWRADLTGSAWSSSAPNEINISAALTQAGTNDAVGTNPDTGISLAIGKRVYIRRLVDTRSPSERRVSIKLNNTATARLPERNFVLQTDPSRTGGAISRVLAPGGSEVLLTSTVGIGPTPGEGVAKTAEATIRRAAATVTYQNATFYRAGTVVRHANKHYQSLRDQVTDAAAPNPVTWGETFVHMPSDYNPEDPLRNEAPILVLDTDTDANDNTATCGINFSTVWTAAGSVRDQYRSGTDYLGVHAFLVALGFSAADAHTALVPRNADARDLDPASVVDFPVAPSGGAATGRGNWAVEFRRPSVLRLYGHAWEWAGFLNYSKSIPAAQKDLSPQNKFTYYFTNDAGGRVVPQGSNEDGFNVSPRGLEDVETGATLSVDQIGNATIDSFQSSDFPNGLTASEITVEILNIGTDVQFPDTSSAKIGSLGPVRLAGASALRSTATVSGSTDAQRNLSIEQEPDVVTLRALNYWKTQNRLVSARSGIQYVYVDPQNGRGTTNVDSLLAEPPIAGNAAIKSLAAAVVYANAAYSPTETVEFRIGPGVYLEKGEIRFTMIARIRAWDFTANSYLNDTRAGGTKPFMGQSINGKSWSQSSSYFLNPANHPVFPMAPRITYRASPEQAVFTAEGITLVFAESGSVTGVVWWGTAQTALSSAVPDSFFSGRSNASTWRAAAAADPDNVLNYMIKAELDLSSSSHVAANGLAFWGHPQLLSFEKTGDFSNIAIGALSPAQPRQVAETSPGLIRTQGQLLQGKGTWLIGNVNISSVLPDSYKANGVATYQLTGHSTSVISTRFRDRPDDGIQFWFNGGGFDSVETGQEADYNLSWNNFHLVNNLLVYPSAANDTNPSGTNWKIIGPAFSGFFYSPIFLGSTNAPIWEANGSLSDATKQGFAGKFGNYNKLLDQSGNFRVLGIVNIRSTFSLRTLSGVSFFRPAGSSLYPSDSGYPTSPGAVGADENYDPLNMRLTPVAKGIDVTIPTTISRNAKL